MAVSSCWKAWHNEKYSFRGKMAFERIVIMLDNRGFKVVVAFVGIVLWLMPQAALGEDVEIKNRLSYISKVVGVIEGSIIKIEGDVRFVKRQAEKTIAEVHLSAKRLDNLEAKIKSVENLLNVIAVEVAKINDSMQTVEKDLEGLFRGSCRNAILCKRKK